MQKQGERSWDFEKEGERLVRNRKLVSGRKEKNKNEKAKKKLISFRKVSWKTDSDWEDLINRFGEVDEQDEEQSEGDLINRFGEVDELDGSSSQRGQGEVKKQDEGELATGWGKVKKLDREVMKWDNM